MRNELSQRPLPSTKTDKYSETTQKLVETISTQSDPVPARRTRDIEIQTDKLIEESPPPKPVISPVLNHNFSSRSSNSSIISNTSSSSTDSSLNTSKNSRKSSKESSRVKSKQNSFVKNDSLPSNEAIDEDDDDTDSDNELSPEDLAKLVATLNNSRRVSINFIYISVRSQRVIFKYLCCHERV